MNRIGVQIYVLKLNFILLCSFVVFLMNLPLHGNRDFLVTSACFILPAKANAKRILTSHSCFRSECFAGVEHKSLNCYSLYPICIPRKYEPGFSVGGS